MARTNFSKVENALKAGIEKMNVDEIGKLAEIAQKAERPELKGLMEKAAKVASKTALERKALKHVIKQGLKEIESEEFWKKQDYTKEEIQQFLDADQPLKKDVWKKLKGIENQIITYKKEEIEKNPQNGNESLIEKERKRHIYKRFNVSEKWLPLK